MNECHWTPGYTTARSMGYRTEPWERYADVLTAVLIGIALATLLVVWWS